MDGNGRWAAARGLPVAEGHREGARALRRTVEAAVETGLAKGLRTPDLAWVGSDTPPMSDLPAEVEVGTAEMTDAVLAELRV